MRYPFYVETIWEVVEQMIKEWQKNPGMFWTEKDVQADLYSRLKQTFLNIGGFYIEDKFNANELYKVPWARVTCNPSVIYSYENEPAKMYPDLVVWDDLDDYRDMDKRYAKIYQECDNWPLLWTCEIKFSKNKFNEVFDKKTIKEWFKTRGDPKQYSWDVDKMNILVDNGKNSNELFGTQYACILHLVSSKAEGNGLFYDSNFAAPEGRLWMLHAYLPKNNE